MSNYERKQTLLYKHTKTVFKMQPTKLIEIVVGIFLYLVLLFLFAYFYMIDQLNDFFKGRTTVTFRLEEAKTIEPPTITICVDPPLKKSVAAQFDFKDSYDLFFKDVPKVSFKEKFQNLSYILNQDYTIQMVLVENDIQGKIEVLEGQIKIDSRDFEVVAIQTYHHGTCYKIQPKFELTKVPFSLRLIFKPIELDEANRFVIYLTSNDSWQGIVTSSWPQYNPSQIYVQLNSYVQYSAKLKEYKFNEGVDNAEQCWRNSIMTNQCNHQCRIVSQVDLPICNSTEDVICIYRSSFQNGTQNTCNTRRRGYLYEGKASEKVKYKADNVTELGLYLESMTKEIREEVALITMPDLIGSIGGSLGLFFGFSFAAYSMSLVHIICTQFFVNFLNTT